MKDGRIKGKYNNTSMYEVLANWINTNLKNMFIYIECPKKNRT